MSNSDKTATIPMFYWSVERNFNDERSGAVAEWVSGSPTKRVALVDHDIHVIDVHDKWEKIVDQIVECEHIISSSLHGSVVA
jgi:hypothetical protein